MSRGEWLTRPEGIFDAEECKEINEINSFQLFQLLVCEKLHDFAFVE